MIKYGRNLKRFTSYINRCLNQLTRKSTNSSLTEIQNFSISSKQISSLEHLCRLAEQSLKDYYHSQNDDYRPEQNLITSIEFHLNQKYPFNGEIIRNPSQRLMKLNQTGRVIASDKQMKPKKTVFYFGDCLPAAMAAQLFGNQLYHPIVRFMIFMSHLHSHKTSDLHEISRLNKGQSLSGLINIDNLGLK